MPLNPDDLADVIADAIKAATAPLWARIAVLEAKSVGASVVGEKGEPGRDGKDAEVDLDALALKVAELIPAPKGVASVTVDDISPLVAECVQKAVAEIPKAKDGAPGQSVDLSDVESMVAKAVSALPTPKDGQSVTVEDVAPLVAMEVEKAVKALPIPKDGVGVSGALINKDGVLVLTLSNGTLHELGLVVGRDGEKGADGVGIQGAPGLNGKDGTIENLVTDYDAETRTMSFFYKDDMRPVEGWSLKMLGSTVYRGIYDPTRTYEIGEQVTYGGSQWTAKSDSIGKQPGTNDGAYFWQLSAKRGNDGKPGTKGIDGKPGPQGPAGRDGTRSY